MFILLSALTPSMDAALVEELSSYQPLRIHHGHPESPERVCEGKRVGRVGAAVSSHPCEKDLVSAGLHLSDSVHVVLGNTSGR